MGISVAMITTWKARCGIASYTCNLSKALSKHGVDVYVVRIPRFGNREASVFQNIVDSIPLDKIDLIHVQHEYGLYVGLDKYFFPALTKLEKPIITTMHAVGQWETDAIIAGNSNKIIVHNEFCRDRFGKEEGKVYIIPHGMTPLETPLPPRDVCKKRLGIQPEAPIVGYVGYISSYKGLDGLVDAMVKVPKAALLIGGGWFVEREPEYIQTLRDRTAKLLPSRCQWLGYVQDEDLAVTYGAMDMVAYPSRYMTESGALLMALSHGKAMLASDLPPVREKEKKGALMTFKGTEDLTEKIKLMLADEELRKHYEECATKFTQENSWAEVAKQHTNLYADVVTP